MIRDRRIEKNDRAIRDAFLDLLFSQRFATIRMTDIAARADVSRSTLYKHFASRESLLLATMEPLLGVIADAASGSPDAAQLDRLLDHFWDNRRLAKAVFGPPVDALVRRSLAAAIEQRLRARGVPSTAAAMIATQVAAGQIALLEAWMTGKLTAERAELAAAMTHYPAPCDEKPE